MTAVWDVWLRQEIVRLRRRLKERRRPPPVAAEETGPNPTESVELRPPQSDISPGLQRRVGGAVSPAAGAGGPSQPKQGEAGNDTTAIETVVPSTDMRSHGISIPSGLTIIACCFGTSLPLSVL